MQHAGCGHTSLPPGEGEPCVVLFAGLQGSGKSTSCIRYAYKHHLEGYKSSLVCTNTSRIGSFGQLRQRAMKDKIPFYQSKEIDSIATAVQGVNRFKREKKDLIVVDTIGSHQNHATLFAEMHLVIEAVKPDQVIFVIDGRLGQDASDQAKEFANSSRNGAVIVTRMDGHLKGGAALNMVAAAELPVVFIGFGEGMDQFERYSVRSFVSGLLGIMSDIDPGSDDNGCSSDSDFYLPIGMDL